MGGVGPMWYEGDPDDLLARTAPANPYEDHVIDIDEPEEGVVIDDRPYGSPHGILAPYI